MNLSFLSYFLFGTMTGCVLASLWWNIAVRYVMAKSNSDALPLACIVTLLYLVIVGSLLFS